MKLKPLGDRLVVIAVEDEETTADSGIVVPGSAKDKPQRGRVLAVGEGDPEHRPSSIEPGDEILYSKYGGTEITVDGEDLFVLREADVLAKVAGGYEGSAATVVEVKPAAGGHIQPAGRVEASPRSPARPTDIRSVKELSGKETERALVLEKAREDLPRLTALADAGLARLRRVAGR